MENNNKIEDFEGSREELISILRSSMDSSSQSEIQRLDSRVDMVESKIDKVIQMMEQLTNTPMNEDEQTEEEYGSMTPMNQESSRQGFENETTNTLNKLLFGNRGSQ